MTSTLLIKVIAMNACKSASLSVGVMGKRDRLTHPSRRSRQNDESLELYGVLDCDEEFARSGAIWTKLGGEPARTGQFTTAELLCGGESENEKVDLGF